MGETKQSFSNEDEYRKGNVIGHKSGQQADSNGTGAQL